MRNQGRYESDAWHQHSIVGFNYRLSEMNCALGCAQMNRIESILASREQVAQAYQTRLGKLADISCPPLSRIDCRISWFVYLVQLAAGFTRAQRDAVMLAMQAAGIGCGRYFAPIHAQPAYAQLPVRHPLPVTMAVSERTLALPFYNQLSSPQIAEVAETLEAAINHVRAA